MKCYRHPTAVYVPSGLSLQDLTSLRMGHTPSTPAIDTILQRMRSSIPPGPTWTLLGPADSTLLLSDSTPRHTRLSLARKIHASSYTAILISKDGHFMLVVLSNLATEATVHLFNPKPGHLDHYVYTSLARALRESFVELPLPWPRSWSVIPPDASSYRCLPTDAAIVSITNLSMLILTNEGHLHPMPYSTREVRVDLLALLIDRPSGPPLPYFSYVDLAPS